MATLESTISTVLTFAQANPFTNRPDTIDSTIVPAPAVMNQQVFQEYFAALRTAVTDGGITANLPFQCVKDAMTWMDVTNCVFFNQVGGGLG